MTKYFGPIWGEPPPDFPTAGLETAYRECIDLMGAQTPPVLFMGQGLKGIAYRFRALAEYDEIFTESFIMQGSAPPLDDHFRQETALFGFFTTGLSCLESLFFAMHAMASHYESQTFRLDNDTLKNVTPQSVRCRFKQCWPNSDLTLEMNDIVDSPEFKNWKDVRNILSHRGVAPRNIKVGINFPINSDWQLEAAGVDNTNEELTQSTTGTRRAWLADHLAKMTNAFSKFCQS